VQEGTGSESLTACVQGDKQYFVKRTTLINSQSNTTSQVSQCFSLVTILYTVSSALVSITAPILHVMSVSTE
jgi:hypothetical protein